jgi:translation initiation factor 1
VWSSDGGPLCPGCGEPQEACTCGPDVEAPGTGATGSRVRVSREVKGRRGKAVTVVRGLPLDAAGLEDLARALKKACGTGGAVKEGTIEIQGDQRDRVVAALAERGYAAKKAGG